MMEMANDTIAALLEQLNEQIKKLNNKLPFLDTSAPSRSTELKDLFTALAKAQAEMPAVAGRKENPYFQERYIDLGDMISAARPSLTKHGLAVIQQILPNEEGQMILHTILSHASGQWIESRVRVIPPKTDVRTLDSYVTSLRRSSYASLVGIVGAGDDDDGEYASATERKTFAKGTALNTTYDPTENKLETITKEQTQELEYELEAYPDIAELVLDGLKIQNIADMPKQKFIHSINRIRNIKRIREGKDI